MNAFFIGATYPLRALVVLIRTPRLWSYVIIPIVVNLLVGTLLYLGLLFGGLRLIDGWVGTGSGLEALLGALLRFVLIVGLFIGLGFVIVRFGVVLGSPWYGKLSEQLEQIRTGKSMASSPTTIGSILNDVVRAVGYELKKLLLVIVVLVALLLLGLIPVVGTFLDLAGGIALGATIACLDFLDGPLERRRLRFRSKLRTIGRGLPATAGFGLVCFGLISIPILNLFVIPICVAAGTLFFCDRYLDI